MMSMNEQLKEAFGQIRAEDQLEKENKRVSFYKKQVVAAENKR